MKGLSIQRYDCYKALKKSLFGEVINATISTTSILKKAYSVIILTFHINYFASITPSTSFDTGAHTASHLQNGYGSQYQYSNFKSPKFMTNFLCAL
jgi:hypothetical protein